MQSFVLKQNPGQEFKKNILTASETRYKDIFHKSHDKEQSRGAGQCLFCQLMCPVCCSAVSHFMEVHRILIRAKNLFADCSD